MGESGSSAPGDTYADAYRKGYGYDYRYGPQTLMKTRPAASSLFSTRKAMFQAGVGAAGLAGLGFVSFLFPFAPLSGLEGAVLFLLSAALAYFPFHLPYFKINLAQPLVLAAFGILGGPTGIWVIVLGQVTGWLLPRPASLPDSGSRADRWDAAFSLGALLLPLPIFALPGLWQIGENAFLPLLVFTLAHSLLLTLDGWLRAGRAFSLLYPRWPSLMLLEGLSLALALFTLQVYPASPIGTWLLSGGVALLMALLLRRLNSVHQLLDRRNREFLTLHMVSEVLRSTLDLNLLFSVLHQEISRLLAVDHFYVALYDPQEKRIRYPLAVKRGQRQDWSDRALSNRLTDRVIERGQPLRYSASDPKEWLEGDLPASVETPTAWVGVPLMASQQVIGCLAVFSVDQETRFKDSDLDLLVVLSGSVGVAIENALLHQDTDQALTQRAQQMAILEGIGRELIASIHSERLVEKILEHARETTQSGWGEITLFNETTQQIEVKASFGYPPEHPLYLPEQGISGRAFRTGEVQWVPNVSADPDYMDLSEGKAHSQISVPLKHHQRVLGVLTLETDRVKGFSSLDRSFILQLADQAALAIVNANLYHEVQRRLREQSTLYLVSNRLATKIELDSVIETVQRALSAAVEKAHTWTYLWDESKAAYLFYTVQSREAEEGSLPERPEPHPTPPAMLQESDFQAWANELEQNFPLQFEGSAEWPPALAFGCPHCRVTLFPLSASHRRLGLVLMHTPSSSLSFHPDELQLLLAITNQCTISLQNALLFSDITHGLDRLAAVLNSVQDGMILIEIGGRITLVNESIQRLIGLKPAELMESLFPLLPLEALQRMGYEAEDMPPLTEDLLRAVDLDMPKKIYRLKESGAERILERTSVSVLGRGGERLGWMIVLRDITEEQAVAQARELLTETLVHDLRSPLSVVLGSLDMIQDDLHETGNQLSLFSLQSVEVARRSTDRVLGLVESLLDIARMQTGKAELTRQPVVLADMLPPLLNDFQFQARDLRIQLEAFLPPDLPAVYADGSKIARVLTNLLDNALKFTPEGGRVWVSASQEGPEIRVQVADTGQGIPYEYRDKIFERFLQVPGQRGRRRGSGLGLTFCRLIVEAHQGQIWVEPNPMGGSIFSFTLPIYQGAGSEPCQSSGGAL